MSDGEISIKMTLEQAELVSKILAIVPSQDKVEAGFNKISRSAAKAEKDMLKMAAAVKAANAAEATPSAKFFDRYDQLQKLRQQGKISQGDFNQAAKREQRNFQDRDPAYKKAREEAEKLAKATRDADEALNAYSAKVKQSNATPIEKYTLAMNKLKEAYRANKLGAEDFRREAEKLGAKLKETDAVKAESFGSSALGQLTQYAVGMASIGAAVNLVRGAFEMVIERQKEGLEISKQLNDEYKQILSLSNSPQERDAFEKLVDESAVKYSITRKDAANTLFEANSTNLSDEGKRTALESGYVLPRAGLSVDIMSAAKANFAGQISEREALNVALYGARESKSSNEDVAKFVPNAMVSGARAGFTYEETVAITTQFGNAFGNMSKASDRFSAMANKIATYKDELDGKQGMEALNMLSKDKYLREDILQRDSESNDAVGQYTKSIERINKVLQGAIDIREGTNTANDFLDEQRRISNTSERDVSKRRLVSQEAATEATSERVYAPRQAAFQESQSYYKQREIERPANLLGNLAAYTRETAAPWYESVGLGRPYNYVAGGAQDLLAETSKTGSMRPGGIPLPGDVIPFAIKKIFLDIGSYILQGNSETRELKQEVKRGSGQMRGQVEARNAIGARN